MTSKLKVLENESRTAMTICVVVMFLCVYMMSLTFAYVEGDDATSIAYHALGRRADVQPPYAPYQSFLDRLLSLLDLNESALLKTAVSITAVGAVLFALCIVWFTKVVWPGAGSFGPATVGLIIPLIVPELFYFGLVYTPAVLAMAMIMASHAIARHAIAPSTPARRRVVLLGSSAVVFGIGGACRWDAATYGIVAFADLAMLSAQGLPRRQILRSLRVPVLWGCGAIMCWLIIVRACGIKFSTIVEALHGSGPVESPSIVLFASQFQSLATPALVAFFIIGLVLLLRQRSSACILLVLSVIPILGVLRLGVPKWIIVCLPAVIATAMMGLRAFVLWMSQCGLTPMVSVVVTLGFILMPWFVGVRVNYADKAWGPGFQLRGYDRKVIPNEVRVVLGDGTAVPTPEGLRPLWGHAYVLVGGRWRQLVQHLWEDQMQAINLAKGMRIPVLQDEPVDYPVVALLSEGFTTTDPGPASYRRTRRRMPPLIERRFSSHAGETVTVYSVGHPMGKYVRDDFELLARTSSSPLIVLVGFPSTMRELYLKAPDAVEVINEVAGVVDLRMVTRSFGDAARSTSELRSEPDDSTPF